LAPETVCLPLAGRDIVSGLNKLRRKAEWQPRLRDGEKQEERVNDTRTHDLPTRADHSLVRRNNLELTLRLLALTPGLSRADLASGTGLTRATVTRLVAELIELGLVREGTVSSSRGVGRPGTPLDIDGRHVLAIGLEVNVDYIAILVRDLGGREVYKDECAFDSASAGPEGSVRATIDLCQSAIRRVRNRKHDRRPVIVGVAAAIPGLVDLRDGVVIEAPNLAWRDYSFGAALRLGLRLNGAPVQVGNDANFAALAEFRIGAWAGTADLIYVTGEVGIGGGIIAGGRPLLGSRGFGGEIGHMRVDPAGPRCVCGRRGCWEALIGMSAVLRSAGISTPSGTHPRRMLETLVRRGAEGNKQALEAIDRMGRDVGVGAAMLSNIFDPSVIILGGYFVALEEWILPRARSELVKGTLGRRRATPDLGVSGLGFTAAARGAALHAMDAVLSDPATLLASPLQ
jgi:predicted NBD/HSP70 family sugar kinase